MSELTINSTNCLNCSAPDTTRGGVVVLTRSEEEYLYCLDCWHELEKKFCWVGVLRFVVLSEHGFSSPEEILALVNRLFGKQFHWLKPFDRGFILQGNETKIEQPSLFEFV